MAKVKVSEKSVKKKVMATRSKIIAWLERSFYKECTYEIREPYIYTGSKVMAKVKVLVHMDAHIGTQMQTPMI